MVATTSLEREPDQREPHTEDLRLRLRLRRKPECVAAQTTANGAFNLHFRITPITRRTDTLTTDTQLQGNVREGLKWRTNVNAAHFGVTAENGVVTLTGQGAHDAEKSAAEEAAQGAYGVNYGVKGLADDISVEMVGSLKCTDPDLAVWAASSAPGVTLVKNDLTIVP